MAAECWIFTEVSFDCLLHMFLDNEFPLQYNKNNDLENKQLSFERAYQRMKRMEEMANELSTNLIEHCFNISLLPVSNSF